MEFLPQGGIPDRSLGIANQDRRTRGGFLSPNHPGMTELGSFHPGAGLGGGFQAMRAQISLHPFKPGVGNVGPDYDGGLIVKPRGRRFWGSERTATSNEGGRGSVRGPH